MDINFENDEKLYRAVYPPEKRDMYWKKDGTLSSAAFKDKKGLSVERGDYRSNIDVIRSMSRYFQGNVACLTVGDCRTVDAYVKYLPSSRSRYHSEIHGSKERRLLSPSQCRHLARAARIIGVLS